MKNKLTFICTKDWHYAGQNPKSRTDSYQQALTAKIREIFDIAKKREADGILVAGDLFDSFYTTLPVIAEYAALLKESPCPIYTIAGQHDEESHNPASLRRAPYGLLVRLGIVRDVVTELAEFNFWTDDGRNWFIAITGRHYDWEADKNQEYYNVCPINPVDYQIHLAHGTLVDHHPPFDRYTHIDDLQTNADVLVVGDYHPGIGIIEHTNTYEDTQRNVISLQTTLIIDPGALARQKAATSDMTRPIQVAVLTVTAEGCNAELVPLECYRPGDEVLSREHLEVEEQREDRIGKFLGLLKDNSARKFAQTREIMDAVALEGEVSGKVIGEALNWVALAREELGR